MGVCVCVATVLRLSVHCMFVCLLYRLYDLAARIKLDDDDDSSKLAFVLTTFRSSGLNLLN